MPEAVGAETRATSSPSSDAKAKRANLALASFMFAAFISNSQRPPSNGYEQRYVFNSTIEGLQYA